jgi:uncharacterized membrane protein
MRVRPWPITLSLRSLASPLCAALLLLFLPHPARADLKLCNRTSYVLETATSTIRNTDSLTQGWTRIIPGDCATVIQGRLSAASYLVYARSSLAHAGPTRAWGGVFPVCAKDGDFVLHQAVAQAYCTAPDTFGLPFAPVNFRGRRDWSMAFDESPALRSLTAAQLAGVKRLLSDNGYKPGAIDGLPNKATAAALTDFRAKMKFKPQDGNDVLFAALEKQAETRSAPQGYTVCNDMADPVLAAIAQIGPGQPRSRGWWRVAPKACARAITTPLAGPVYLLAQKLSGAAVVGGAEKFCTTSIIFDVEGRGNCATRGLAESGFIATAGNGATGYVAHIGAGGLVR